MAWYNFWKKENRTATVDNTPVESNFGTGWSLFHNSNQDAVSLSAVFSAIEIISNTVAELPINVKTQVENKVSIVKDHPLYGVFNSGLLTKFMLVKMMISDMLLYGNGFAYIKRSSDGSPIELIYLPKGKCTVFYNSQIRKLYYHAPSVQSGAIEPINMLHFVKNSKNGVEGIGVLKYADNTIKLAGYTEKAARDYFSSGCHVSGILKTTNPSITLNEQKRNAIRDAWRQGHGKDGTGMAIIEGGMEYQPISSNSKDAQLLESRLFNLQDIARFFNINPVLLGDLSHSSYSTIEASLLEFVTHTLFPYITLVENELTRKLIKPSEKNLYIDLDEAYIIKSDKSSEATYLNTLVSGGIMTTNEARYQLGLNPVDGGDKLVIPYTKIDDNTIGEQGNKADDKSNTDNNNDNTNTNINTNDNVSDGDNKNIEDE